MLLGLVVVIAVLVSLGGPQPVEPQTVRLAPVETARPFERAIEPVELRFPFDHGPHLDYQTEWWYFTGNLSNDDGDHFGYQLTIFRRGLAPGESQRESNYAANHIYFGHLALTDVARDRHVAYERFSRGAVGFAGASGDPFEVYLSDWSIQASDAATQEISLKAAAGELAISLILRPRKPPVLHGDRGLSPKSDQIGSASYYVSYTRLSTSGVISLGDSSHDVAGESWFDHEWGTSALGPQAIGWDWFGLQLDDERELMLFQIRLQNGGVDSASSGTLVEADGSTQQLGREDFSLEPLRNWRSEATGATYPLAWRVRIPERDLELIVEPRLDDQENQLGIVYWEGAVQVSGSASGFGYLELTGYKDPLTELY